MVNNNAFNREKFVKYKKARKFIREYYKANGVLPTEASVRNASVLTQEEIAQIELDGQMTTLAQRSVEDSE